MQGQFSTLHHPNTVTKLTFRVRQLLKSPVLLRTLGNKGILSLCFHCNAAATATPVHISYPGSNVCFQLMSNSLVPRRCVDFISRMRVISTPSGLVPPLVVSLVVFIVCVVHSWTALMGPSLLPPLVLMGQLERSKNAAHILCS